MSEQKKPRTWVRWVLVASLALNLLIVGAIVGAILSGGPQKARRMGDVQVGRGLDAIYVIALDRADRRAMRRELRAQVPDANKDAVRAAVDEVIAVLRSDPFDAEAFRAALARQSEMHDRFKAAGREALTAKAAEMDAKERLDYADRLQEILENPGKRYKKRKRP